MTWISLARYLKKHCRVFISSSLFGVALGFLLTPWVVGQTWVRNFLASHSLTFHFGIVLLTAAVLIPTWPRAVVFWRRYRRTQALDHPPTQNSDSIALGIFAGIVTGLFLLYFALEHPTISNPAYISLLCLTGLFLLWLLSSWAQSHRDQKSTHQPVSFVQHDVDYPDDPIISDDEDLLGRVHFVDRLVKQIVSLPFANSFVFGLHGSWGEGKTSVLNLLQGRLTRNPNVILVTFNPWYFANETALVEAFYSAVEQALQRRYILSGLHGTIKRYKDLLTFGLRYLGIQFPVKDDPERLRSELESWVRRTSCRIVIVIDDIDRLQSDEMLAVLKLARLSARLQHAIFLLSFDQEVVIDVLRNTAKVDPEFLEKIIQKPVPLPPAEQRDIDRFLFFSDPGGPDSHRSAIDRFLDELQIEPRRRKDFDDKMSFFYQTRLRRLFRTMRHAKRYLNALRATLPPIVGEVNLYDFFLLEVLHVFCPKIYKDIWNFPWFYLPAWAHEIFLVYPFAHVQDENEKFGLIRQHIERLLKDEPQREIAQEILEELFFVQVKNAFKEWARAGYDSGAQTYEAEKRLTHPKCFPRYFLSRIPAGEFADQLIESLIHGWNSTPDPENVIYQDLYQYQQKGQLLQLFEKLYIFRQLVYPERVPAIARAIRHIAPALSRTANEPWNSEYYRAERFLLSLINDRADPEEIEPIIQELVSELNSFPSVVSVVYECGTSESGSYFRIYKKVDITSLRKLASDRLYEHFIQGNRNIFEELAGRDLVLVLYQWATNWRTDSSDNRLAVENYTMKLIDRQPEYLGILLSEFRTRTISGEYSGFDFQAFIKVFDPLVIADRLVRYGETALITPEAKEAAKLFSEQYEVYKSRNEKSGE